MNTAQNDDPAYTNTCATTSSITEIATNTTTTATTTATATATLSLPTRTSQPHHSPPSNRIPPLPYILRTSPCAMHSRRYIPTRCRDLDLDLLYSTSCHGGARAAKVNERGSHSQRDSYSDSQADDVGREEGIRLAVIREKGGHDCSQRERGGQDVTCKDGGVWKLHVLPAEGAYSVSVTLALRARRQLQYQQNLFRAALPGPLASTDLVTAWLRHGSAPVGHCHFPDIDRH